MSEANDNGRPVAKKRTGSDPGPASIDALKGDYRRIEAPPHIQTRIRAEVADRPMRGHRWMPATATALVAVTAVWLLPALWQQPGIDAPRPSKPSLSALAALKPDKPAALSPSLTQLKSVPTPRMPRKPRLKPQKPQTNFENDALKEKDHAYT